MSNPSDTVAAEEEIPASETPVEQPEFGRENLSPDQRMDVLGGKGAETFEAHKQSQSKADDGAKPQGEEKDEEAIAEEAAKAESAKSEEGEDDGPIKMPKLRITPKDAKELQFDSLRKDGKGAEEAFKEVYGDNAPTPKVDEAKEAKADEAKKAEEQADSKMTQFDANIEKAENELSEMEQRLADANEAEDIAASTKLTREIVNKEFEVKELKGSREQFLENQTQEELSAHDTKVQSSADEVYDKFPTLADETSADRKEFIEFYTEKGKDPDYAGVFKSPKWPEIMAREFTMSKGILPAGAKPQESPTPPVEKKEAKKPAEAPAKKQEALPKQTPAAKKLTSGDGHQDGSTQVSSSTYQKDRVNMTLEKKKSLLGTLKVSM